jgi:anti-sigma B factor antagonist
MEFSIRQVGGVAVLDLAGKITAGFGDGKLREAVGKALEEGHPRILLNLEKVPYMDSAGLGALVACHVSAKNAGSVIKLLNPLKRVYDLLHIVKLDSVFECFHDEGEAVASF